MLDVMDYRRSLERSRLSRMRRAGASTFTMLEREWDLLPGVFAPSDSPSTAVALDLLGLAGPSPSARGSVLEIGCGTGIIAVAAALAGCERVVASDISRTAAENAALNAARHGVADRVRTVQGDLFAGLDPEERFDTVFWSSNYVMAPEGYDYQDIHERAYVDAGYQAHRRFLAEAPGRLAPNGSVLLHFSSRGDLVSLLRIAGECGRALRMLRVLPVQEGEHEVQHMLIEVAQRPQRPHVPGIRTETETVPEQGRRQR
ncbi:methyltransferase domain-containing protein [Peterkaempfera bronchialis]|uniref:Methyltransferase domain-containing protein n=2 Tax=Peterkaempfera bronchialis TaxID=2126346 RepID=A0A345T614_9ACTN|nr:methyltransferase domain-containing protein [Peterkaempfera bronchialis]